MTCLFCRVVEGTTPATILFRDDLVTAFRDVRPQAPTHILVVPNAHIPSSAHLREEHRDVLSRLFTVAATLAEQEGVAGSGYRLLFNVGRDAGQSVDHLHLHLLGGRRLGWPPG